MRHGNIGLAMSLMGQTRTFGAARSMSELPTIADIERMSRKVRDVPRGDLSRCSNVLRLLNHLVGQRE